MKNYNDFLHIIRGKNILYIPIISCINRDTGEYNLSADGNVNRFITTFQKCPFYSKLKVVLPSKHIEGSESIINKFTRYNTFNSVIYSPNFGIHAGEQRNKDEVVDALFEEIKDLDFDICIFESQKLGLKMMDYRKDKEFIFWNPVSKTKTKTRIFLEGYDEINSKIIDRVNYMIIASPDQAEFYNYVDNKLVYLDILIDRNLYFFEYKKDKEILNKFKNEKRKIFYLPFRLSDEGYKFDKVLEYLEKEKDDFIVLYSDPNNSHIVDKGVNSIFDKFIKVSSNRDTYYTILDYIKCTILYFEDLEFINHAAIHEFMNSKSICDVILYNQTKNPYNVKSCNRIKILYD